MALGVGVAVLLIALVWFFWPAPAKDARKRSENPELDEAEREVQEAPDEENIRDWGPGTGQKPLP